MGKQLLSVGEGVLWVSKILIIWSVLIVGGLGQAKSNARVNEIYMVKFTKSSLEIMKSNLINKKILTQIEFLEKLVRNIQQLLAQQTHYVNFTVKANTSNFSNLTQNIKNNSVQSPNPKPTTTAKPASATSNQKINNILNIASSTNTTAKNNTGGIINLTPNATINTTTPQNTNFNSNVGWKVAFGNESTNSSSTAIRPNTTSTLGLLSPIGINAANLPRLKAQVNNTIVNKQFTGIGLYHDIPANFAKGETFKFSGTVTDPSVVLASPTVLSSNYNFVNVIFSKVQSNQQIKCIQKISRDNLQFQVACPLDVVGSYYLSVFAGQSGYSSRTLRKVVQPPVILPNLTTPAKPQSLFLQIGGPEGDLFVNWFVVSAITKVTFTQKQTSMQFTLSNYAYRLRVPHANFIGFEAGPTNVSIAHANSKDGTYLNINSQFGEQMYLTFQSCQHLHSSSQDENVQVNPPIPWQLKINQQFKINAVFKTNAQNQVYIVSPIKEIEKLYFYNSMSNNKSSLIPAGTPATISVRFSMPGPHLIEINEDTGLALVNRPIYVGNVFPLMPDYIDLKTASILTKTDTKTVLQSYVRNSFNKPMTMRQPSLSGSLTSKRQYMFELLNLLRTREIIEPVYLDDRLTEIAQSHADDMKRNNYFSHINLQGEGPGQRAKRYGFNGAIGENIAQSTSLTQAHLSLERSAAHFENSISPLWTRVGIGISQTTFGQYIVAFQFSSRDILKQPLGQNQLQRHQKQLIQMLLRKFPNLKSQNKQVTALIGQWMDGPRNLQIMPYLITRNIRSLLTSSVTRFNYYPQFVAEIEKQDNVFGNIARYSQVGANLRVSRLDPTVIQCYFIFLT